MNTFTDRLLDTMDRMTSRIGVGGLIDGLMDRIAPKATALAGCSSGGYQDCSKTCTTTVCYGPCVNHLKTVYHLQATVFTPCFPNCQSCSQTCYDCNSNCGTYGTAAC